VTTSKNRRRGEIGPAVLFDPQPPPVVDNPDANILVNEGLDELAALFGDNTEPNTGG
jgi:hypothetical protein